MEKEEEFNLPTVFQLLAEQREVEIQVIGAVENALERLNIPHGIIEVNGEVIVTVEEQHFQYLAMIVKRVLGIKTKTLPNGSLKKVTDGTSEF